MRKNGSHGQLGRSWKKDCHGVCTFVGEVEAIVQWFEVRLLALNLCQQISNFRGFRGVIVIVDSGSLYLCMCDSYFWYPTKCRLDYNKYKQDFTNKSNVKTLISIF